MSRTYVGEVASSVRRSVCRQAWCLLAVLALGWPSVSRAAPTTIDFETLPGGAALATGTRVTNEFQSVGVVFSYLQGSGDEITNYSPSYGSIGQSLTHWDDMTLTFSPTVSRVKFTAGAIDEVYIVTAYDGSNNVVDTATVADDENYVDTTVEVQGAGIARVEINTSPGDGVVIDNLEFDQAAADTDLDGTPDDQETCDEDPDKTAPGICGCGVVDDPTDSDVDAVPDCVDGCPNDVTKTAAGACGCGMPDTDTDSDGTPDCNDGCPNDMGKQAAGACGCGTPDVDADSDESYSCNDSCDNDPLKSAPGICGCGTADTDTDVDETADCNDGCPTDPGKIAAGACGCGTPDTDGDSDGTPDCMDGCDEDPNKTAPGTCGCGTPDDDDDGDGILNCYDQCVGKDSVGDSDQDGICNDRDDRVIVVTEQFEGERGICGVGGVAITTGVDRDDDGVVDESESYGTDYACTGPRGPEGRQVRFISEILEPGDVDCPAGGVRLLLGIDDNMNGELDQLQATDIDPQESEVDATHYICNGQKTVAAIVPIEPGELCRTGGVEFSIGIDDNGNGVLDTTGPLGNSQPQTEVDVTQRICNGLNSLVKITRLEPQSIPQTPAPSEPEIECPTGGIHVAAGTDTDGDAVLDDGEVRVEQNVCNGLDGLVALSTLDKGSEQCPTGGVLIRSGTDEDADGQVDEGEEHFSRPVCNGLPTLVVSTTIEPNTKCPVGGSRIDAGVDDDADGTLDANEIDTSETICNGLHSISKATPLAADAKTCPRGGATIATGTDKDGDGTLDDDEISSTQNVCAGLSSLSRTSSVAADPKQCPFGGSKLESGPDKDGDGTLDDDEVSSTQILCGGTGLAVRTKHLDIGSDDCATGGVQVETGIDVNGDAMLGDDEVQHSDAVCQPAALLFETETLGENSKRCEHGGLRVFSGHDDGDPDGTPGDGELQEGEIELDRDVCLAPTDVLVNGGSGECTVTTLGTRGNALQAFGLLLAAVVFATRRRKRSQP